jgi:glycosyltransferase involved in cell wall biosynthesis
MISFVVCSYNQSLYVEQCIQSIQNVPIIEKEIIIIDDSSTDGSKRTILQLKEKISTIQVVIKESNRGLIDSLNMGVLMAKYPYVYFIAADDFVDSDHFVECYHKMVDQKKKFIIFGAKNYFNETCITEVYNERHCDFFHHMGMTKNPKNYVALKYPSPLLIQSTLFEKTALECVGGWDERLILDDMQIFIKLFLKYKYDNDYIFMPGCNMVYYRHHGQNSYLNLQRQYMLISQLYNSLFEKKVANKYLLKKRVYYLLLSLKKKNYGTFFWFLKKCL